MIPHLLSFAVALLVVTLFFWEPSGKPATEQIRDIIEMIQSIMFSIGITVELIKALRPCVEELMQQFSWLIAPAFEALKKLLS